jgi:hypothetical protein
MPVRRGEENTQPAIVADRDVADDFTQEVRGVAVVVCPPVMSDGNVH